MSCVWRVAVASFLPANWRCINAAALCTALTMSEEATNLDCVGLVVAARGGGAHWDLWQDRGVRRALPLLALCLSSCDGITTKLCGAPGQPCCPASACDANAVCGAAELCQACGGEGQVCCAQAVCAEPLSCVSGTCTRGLSCEASCTLGSSRCVNNGIETCTAAGVCPAWRTTLALCPGGSACTVTGSVADCLESCPGACTPDAQLCTNEGLRRCVAAGPCPTLVAEADNSDLPACITGGVVDSEVSWESPTPVGSTLVDIAGELTGSYWVLDDLGNIIRYALGPWEYEVRPTVGKRMLHIASCGLGSRLYAAGEGGTVLRRAAAMWTEENVGAATTLTGVTCDTNRAYAAGADGKLYVRDGTSWTGYPTGSTAVFTDITSVFSQQRVYLSGRSGLIVACGVSVLPPSCTTEPSGTTASLNAIWGDSFTNTVFAVGDDGTLLERTARWERIALSGVSDHLVGISGWHDSSVDATTIAAISAGGTAIIRRGPAVAEIVRVPDTGFTNVWAPNERTLVFTAVGGGLWFRNGLTSRAPFVARGGRKPITANLLAVTSIGQGRLFAVGEGGARFRRQNGAWSVDALGANTAQTLRGVAARSAGEVYAVGDQGTVLVRRWGTWFAEAQGLTTEDLLAVVLDTGHVWVLGQSQLLEKNLATGEWRTVALPQGTPKVTSLALRKNGTGEGTELVIAGHRCTSLSLSLHNGGFTAGPDCGSRFDFNAAAFLASGDLLLASTTGTIHRRTGGTLTFENVSGIGMEPFYGLVPDGSGMWALGAGGRLFRRIATNWSVAAPEVTKRALNAGVKDDDGLFIVGPGGLVLRRL